MQLFEYLLNILDKYPFLYLTTCCSVIIVWTVLIYIELIKSNNKSKDTEQKQFLSSGKYNASSKFNMGKEFLFSLFMFRANFIGIFLLLFY